MSIGGSKPKKAKVKGTPNLFSRNNAAEFTTDFGTGTSGLYNYLYTDDVTGQTEKLTKITADAKLNPELQQAGQTAQTGLNNNLGYINRTPQQQAEYALGGNDPYYNVLSMEAARNRKIAEGRMRLNAQRGGVSNSTTLGSGLGTIANEDILRRNAILTNAMQYGNQTAIQNAGTNLGVIGSLAQLSYPLASAANSAYMTGAQSANQSFAQTAAAQNAAELQYANALNAYNAQNAGSLGSGIGSLLGAGSALALAPFTGGASLSYLPMASNLGGSIGSGVTGGGYSPVSLGDVSNLPALNFSMPSWLTGGGGTGGLQPYGDILMGVA